MPTIAREARLFVRECLTAPSDIVGHLIVRQMRTWSRSQRLLNGRWCVETGANGGCQKNGLTESHPWLIKLTARAQVFQATNRSSNCQKEGPYRIARALHQIKFELEAPSGADATPSRRGLGERHIAVEVDIEEALRSRTGGPRWWPPRRPRGCWRARRSPRGRSRPRRRRGGRARSGGLRHARSGRSRL